jgi:hypothetical protein
MGTIEQAFGSQADREAAAQFGGDDSPLGDAIPGQITIDGHEVAPADPVPPIDEIVVAGTQESLFDVGGKQPSSASLRLMGGAYKLLQGQGFSKGEVVTFSGTAIIREVAMRDSTDPKTKRVVSAEQKHLAEITDLKVSGAE